MLWLLLALLAASSTALKEGLIKVAMRRRDEFVIVFWMAAVTALVLTPAAILAGGGPAAPRFWVALIVSGGINVVAALFIARAVFRSELSLVSPLQSLTPLFMLITSPLILAEWATPPGTAGIAALVAGTYVVSAGLRRGPLLAPFQRLYHDPGARLMLGVAFLFSISANVDKVGVLASDPLTWGAAVHAFVALALLPRMLRSRWRRRPGAPREPLGYADNASLFILGAGAAVAVAAAAQMTALLFANAAYVIAVKRTSILLAVLAGGLIFGEQEMRGRLVGATLMVLGVLLLALA